MIREKDRENQIFILSKVWRTFIAISDLLHVIIVVGYSLCRRGPCNCYRSFHRCPPLLIIHAFITFMIGFIEVFKQGVIKQNFKSA